MYPQDAENRGRLGGGTFKLLKASLAAQTAGHLIIGILARSAATSTMNQVLHCVDTSACAMLHMPVDEPHGMHIQEEVSATKECHSSFTLSAGGVRWPGGVDCSGGVEVAEPGGQAL